MGGHALEGTAIAMALEVAVCDQVCPHYFLFLVESKELIFVC
jgi:hypothetical protein